MGDFLIIPSLNCIKITQKQAWRSLIYFAWTKYMYFREYVCRFSRKLHYFYILGVSHLNSLCPGISDFKLLNFKRNSIQTNITLGWILGDWYIEHSNKHHHVLNTWGIDILSIQINITLKWMSEDLIDGKSTLFQVMAWCRQATIHCLSRYWPRSLSLYCISRPRWLNAWTALELYVCTPGVISVQRFP